MTLFPTTLSIISQSNGGYFSYCLCTTVTTYPNTHVHIYICYSSGDILYKAATFKNTGTVAFTYEWSVVKDDEAKDPPEVSTISELLGRADMKDMLSREHSLSSERSPIYCMKSKGIILPGEIVQTLFSFSARGTAGAVTEAWALDTHPRANIAIDPLGKGSVMYFYLMR